VGSVASEQWAHGRACVPAVDGKAETRLESFGHRCELWPHDEDGGGADGIVGVGESRGTNDGMGHCIAEDEICAEGSSKVGQASAHESTIRGSLDGPASSGRMCGLNGPSGGGGAELQHGGIGAASGTGGGRARTGPGGSGSGGGGGAATGGHGSSRLANGLWLNRVRWQKENKKKHEKDRKLELERWKPSVSCCHSRESVGVLMSCVLMGVCCVSFVGVGGVLLHVWRQCDGLNGRTLGEAEAQQQQGGKGKKMVMKIDVELGNVVCVTGKWSKHHGKVGEVQSTTKSWESAFVTWRDGAGDLV